MSESDNYDEKTVNEVLDKIRNNYKTLDEDNFNYELILGSSSESLKLLNASIEKELEIVNSHPDSQKRFEIITKFLDRLESEKSFDISKANVPEHDFLETKKGVQNLVIPFENYKKFGDSNDMELAVDALCKMYAHSYEDACKSYFKLYARIITGKKIDSCGTCINIILEYEPEMQFVLQYFMSQIRNSIDHNDQYYDYENKLMVFPDREKESIKIPIEHLRTGCSMQIVNKVCLSAAEDSKRLDAGKVSLYYYEKTEEYCKILQIDFKQVLKLCLKTGMNLLRVHNVLERKIKSLE